MWHFAYKSILEEIVRRRRNNWSWVRMKAHRQLVKRYKEAWLNKQTETNLGEEDKVILKKAEEELDVFNLNVARQLADIEIVRRGLTRLKDQPHRRLSWVQTWLGGAEQKKSLVDTVKSNLKEAMIAKEKAKLFEAIDYQENAPPTNYPKHFIENVVRAQLNSLMIIIDDALSMNLFSFTAKLQQRPSAKAINIETAIKSVAMSDHCGHPVLTMMDESTQLLTLYVDVDPLGRESTNYDLLVKLNIEPTILKYHAIVISSLVDTFTPPQTVKLNRFVELHISEGFEDYLGG
ncbi:unnamed protein product [Toxocara canis]|uniref:VPS13 domain-containing protein n=1 Tax=Toxocara canis TaxID=6265 RepID=A0A183V3B5_TOXCA|nr:unnamed protein product [Toxocara canis]